MAQFIPDFIDAERLDRLRDAAGLPNDRQLALKLGVSADQPARWKSKATNPSGPTLAKLCKVLHTTAEYLYGIDEPTAMDRQRQLIEEVKVLFGRSAADVVEHLGRLTDHHKSILAGRIVGWVEGLEEYERRAGMPETQFDRDLAQLQAAGILTHDDEKEEAPAGGDVVPHHAQP